MEKVKLTETQNDAIERKIKEKGKLALLKEHINGYFRSSFCLSKKGIDTEKLIKALYIGYEVEPEFKEGQWIVLTLPFTKAKITARILDIDVGGDNRVRLDRDCHCWWDKEDIRLATPSEIAEEKERRFFHRHGREPWKLKGKDLIADTDRGIFEVIKETEPRNGYWVESFFGWGHYVVGKTELRESGLTGRFEVVCFAEDRKDVDND